MSEEDQRKIVRRSVVDQISVDPMTGFPFSLAARLRDAPRLGL